MLGVLAKFVGLEMESLRNQKERDVFAAAERIYSARGCPQTSAGAAKVLREIYDTCGYVKFLYWRMKQCERGEWPVKAQAPAVPERSEASRIAEARATMTEEQFARFLAIRSFGKPAAQPQKANVVELRKVKHG